MSASIFPPMQAAPVRKKRVLLVDSFRPTRDLRSETMRRLGAEVDCAADIIEARSWWRADLYNLVLMSVEASQEQTERFCGDIRRVMPNQQIMFFVGKPAYLSASPTEEQISSAKETDSHPAFSEEVKTSLGTNGSGNISQHWGILEACRRISAVRSKLEARSRALRDRPVPQRDSEVSRPRRPEEAANLLDLAELLREETQ